MKPILRTALRRGASYLTAMIVASALSGHVAHADDGLYAAPPPPNSAFVRFIANAAQAGDSATLGEDRFEFSANPITPYQIIAAGQPALNIKNVNGDVEIGSGNFYTVLVNLAYDPPYKLLQDEGIANPANAGLYFYNSTDADGLTLQVTAGGRKLPVFKDQARGTHAFREVGSRRVGFEVLDKDGNVIGSVEPTLLEKNIGYTIAVAGAGETSNVFLVKNDLKR